MVNKLCANIPFCVKLFKSLRHNCRVTSSQDNFVLKKFYLLYARCKGYNIRLLTYLIMLQNRELYPKVGNMKHQKLSLFARPIYFFLNVCAQFYFCKFNQANLKEVYLIILLRQPENLLLKRSRECIISDTNLEITLIMSQKSADMSSVNRWNLRCH